MGCSTGIDRGPYGTAFLQLPAQNVAKAAVSFGVIRVQEAQAVEWSLGRPE
jgi:hypothetical protein